MRVPTAEVLIVGGGAAGLSTAAALTVQGIPSVVLDQDERIGGSWERRYDRLHLHTVRTFSSLAHHPLPRSLPRYVPKDDFARYLREYAGIFELRLVASCAVTKVHPPEAGEDEWRVQTGQGEWRAPAVVLATGQFGRPFVPDWPGGRDWRGEISHSSAYRNPEAYRGRRVLVVGAGNSGCEIAADLAQGGAAEVAIAIRTPPPIVPRDFLGVPVQMFGMVLGALPPHVADRIARALARLALGDLGRFGLRRAAWSPFLARRLPVIDVGFVAQVRAGRVRIRPGLAGFRGRKARFEDGEEDDYDAVIAATGFRPNLADLLGRDDLLTAGGIPRFASGRPTPLPGLFFVGYVESFRGHLYEANRDSRRLARFLGKARPRRIG